MELSRSAATTGWASVLLVVGSTLISAVYENTRKTYIAMVVQRCYVKDYNVSSLKYFTKQRKKKKKTIS